MKLLREAKKEPFALISPEEAAVWEAKRVDGKWRWIGKAATRHAIVVFILMGIVNWITGSANIPSLLGLFVFTVVGVVVSTMAWNQQEFDYQRYLHEKSKEVEEPPLGSWRSDTKLIEYETERTNS